MLISVIPREEYLTIYRKLYWGSSEAVGKQTQKVRLVELCGLLACGCEHAVDVPAEFRQACKDTVKIFLDEITEISELRAMRIYTLCAMFSLLDKPTAAWSYVGMSLQTGLTVPAAEDDVCRFRIGFEDRQRMLSPRGPPASPS